MNHSEAMARIAHRPAGLAPGIAGGDEEHAVQRECRLSVPRDQQVGDVDRVEGAAQYTEALVGGIHG